MNLTFSKPVIDPSAYKPVALANKGYPYDKLPDSRRFEELIYSIYQKEIVEKTFEGIYDDINLLQGVRERGRDCTFHYKGVCAGVIQCKHSIDSSNRISKPECAREIIKFVLHAIVDPTLIPDAKTFTYFFVVSYGFAETALTLIDDFNNNILNELDFEEWTQKVIDGNEELSSLGYNTIEPDLKRILSQIQVHKVLPQDLDLFLNKPGNEAIIQTFFEVRTVIDVTTVTNAISELRDDLTSYSHYSNIPSALLFKKLEDASFHLSKVINEFEQVPDSHIPRNETQAIYQWIKNVIPPEERPIALLVGNAGMGKTVILKDLMSKLIEESIPTLGIKADRYYVNSIDELTKRLGLEDSIEKIINSLRVDNEKVVILIDQIDALSQSLSAKREYLDTFNMLVNNLSRIDSVRIIISVRTYDLNYDTDLTFYKKQRKFVCSLLDVSDVISVLNKIGVPANSYSGILIELLRTPHHLNVFCKIYNGTINLSSIKTLHDLYDYLWMQKVNFQVAGLPVTKESCKSAIYRIAQKMYAEQKISILGIDISEDFKEEISYFRSNDILTSGDSELQFFHQTFYDYVFAKQFIENKNDIAHYLNENNQGLFIRSSLKMIIAFLRRQDHSRYIDLLTDILFSNNYKFHLKLLIINLLAFEDDPTNDETDLALNRIFKSRELLMYFLESANGQYWLELLIKKNILFGLLTFEENSFKTLIEKVVSRKKWLVKVSQALGYVTFQSNSERVLNTIYSLLIRSLPQNRKVVLEFLKQSPEFPNKGRFITRILYFIKVWDQPDAFELFEQYKDEFKVDSHGFYRILEDALNENFKWVLHTYRNELQNRMSSLSVRSSDKMMFHYEDDKLLNKIIEIDFLKGFEFTLQIVKSLLNKTSPANDSDTITESIVFMFYDDDRNLNGDGPNAILHILIDSTKHMAETNGSQFRLFFEENKYNNSASILLAILHGLLTNPKEYADLTIDLSKIINNKGGFNNNGKLAFWLRKLISNSYPLFDLKQKEVINDIYLSISPKNELSIFIENDRKFHRLQYYGYLKFVYLSSLTEAQICPFPRVFKEYQILKRKFPEIKIIDNEPNVIRVNRGISAPFSDRAYTKMKYEDWVTTFKKFNEERFDTFYGSMVEHCRAFQDEVSTRPGQFVDLIIKLINESDVPFQYIVHGIQGLEGGNFDPNQLLSIYKDAARLNFDREYTLYMVWAVDYFLKNRVVDEQLLNILINYALHHSDPAQEKSGAPFDEINTVRGAAASRLPEFYFRPEFKELIFTAMNKVAEDKILGVKVAALTKIASLNFLDVERSFNLFLKLIKNAEPEIIRVSLLSINYMINHDFKRLIPFFNKVIENGNFKEDISTALSVAWVSGKQESYPLLLNLIKDSKEAKIGAINVAINNMFDPEIGVQEKCIHLFKLFLNEADSDISQKYGFFFLKLEPERFVKILPLIKLYSKSKVAGINPHYFYEYLLKCVKKHPMECIDLMAHWKSYQRPDITQSGYYDHEPISIVIGCYNALRNTVEGRRYIAKALDMFDDMLKIDRFRSSAGRVIEQVEM